MALVTLGGADVLSASVHLRARGPWFARARLDTATAPTGAVTVKAEGGLSLSGFVRSGGIFCDVAEVQVVGGAGGIGKTMLQPTAYENAQLRDPLNAVLQAAGETLSSEVEESLLSVRLAMWTQLAQRAIAGIDTLCFAAGQALGKAITWRVLDDGKVWLGAESWPATSLPAGSDLLKAFPEDGRYIIGADTPSLLPGVALEGVGNVRAVDHWITSHEVRSWAWT